MSIQNKTSNSKGLESDISFDSLEERTSVHTTILLIILLIFSCFSAFALGRLSVLRSEDQQGVVIETIAPDLLTGSSAQGNSAHIEAAEGSSTNTTPPFLVGSKNSDKYHYPWCSGALRINPENLVSFASFEEARAVGYTPAGNCDGLQ